MRESRCPRWIGAPLLVLCVVALASPGSGEARPATTPGEEPADQEERDFEREAVRAVVRDNCLICHSEELLNSQKLSRAQWKSEVEKMVGWGAPLSAEQLGPVIDFLAQEYSESAPSRPPARISYEQAQAQYAPEASTAAARSGDADRGSTLYRAHCATCHGEGALGADLGSNLVEAAVLARPGDYATVVHEGRRRMPGFKLVLRKEQENDILSWLRRQRYGAPPSR